MMHAMIGLEVIENRTRIEIRSTNQTYTLAKR